MYSKGELDILETKYTDFVRRQNSQDMAPKKVMTNNSNKNSNSKNQLKRTNTKDSIASSTNSDSSVHSSSANRYSASYARGDGGGGGIDEKAGVGPDFGSLVKFSQMFNTKNSYALRQKEIWREEQRKLYGDSGGGGNGKRRGGSEDSSEGEDDDESVSSDDDFNRKLNNKVVLNKNGDKPPKEELSQLHVHAANLNPSMANTVPEPKPEEPVVQTQPIVFTQNPSASESHVQAQNQNMKVPTQQPWRRSGKSSFNSEDDDDGGTTSTDKTEASTLGDMNSQVLRQELLQNIRAISGATFFDEHDPQMLEAIADAVASDLEAHKVRNGHGTRHEADDERGDGGGGTQGGNHDRRDTDGHETGTKEGGNNNGAAEALSEEHEFLYFNRKTPSANSKTKSIDNWIENSHRANNNNPIPLPPNSFDADAGASIAEAAISSMPGSEQHGDGGDLIRNDLNQASPHPQTPIPTATNIRIPREALGTPSIGASSPHEEPATGFRGILGKVFRFGQQPKPPTSTHDYSSSGTTDNNNPNLVSMSAKLPFSKHEDMDNDLLGDNDDYNLLKHNLARLPPGSLTRSPMLVHGANSIPLDAATSASSNLHEETETKYSIFKRTKQVLSSSRRRFPLSASLSNDRNSSSILPATAEQTVRYNLLPSLRQPSATKLTPPSVIHKRKQLPAPKLPGVLARQKLDCWVAKIVWFYVNGDEFHPRLEYRFRPGKDIHNFEQLCDVLSTRIGLPRGVRFVFTLDGQLVWRLEHLKHEHAYVVSSMRKFKPLDYGRLYAVDMNYENGHPATAPFNTRNFQSQQALPIRREHSFNDVRTSRMNYGYNNATNSLKSKSTKGILLNNTSSKRPSEVESLISSAINQSSGNGFPPPPSYAYAAAAAAANQRPIERQVIAIINGLNPKVHSQVLLNTRVSQEWDELVKDLGMSVKIPKHFNRIMKTGNGRSVLSYSQLRSELRTGNQTFYIFPLKKPPVEPALPKLNSNINEYKELNVVALEREQLRNDMRKLALEDGGGGRRKNRSNQSQNNDKRHSNPNHRNNLAASS